MDTTQSRPDFFTELEARFREWRGQLWDAHAPAIIVAGLILGYIVLNQLILSPLAYKRHCAEAKENLHSVQLALERFACDSPGCTYPATTEALIKEGYLSELPQNPFSGEPMKEYRLGELPSEGDFVYAPQIDTDGSIAGYDLALGEEAAQRLQEYRREQAERRY